MSTLSCQGPSLYFLSESTESNQSICLQAALAGARTDKNIMNKNMKKTEAILRDMVNITVRGDLSRIQRINLETCITVHMHQKESTGVLWVHHNVRGALLN